MPNLTLPLNKGCASGVDPSLIKPGELQEAEGVIYKPGDEAAHKHGGRTSFATVTAAAVNGLAFIDFDTADDLLIAQSNGSLYSSTIAGASFAAIRTGLTASATQIDGTKFSDNYVCCNGVDTNWLVLNSNTTIRHGLDANTVAPTHSLAGSALTGVFDYWATEWDNTNSVESAFTGTALSVTAADDIVTITKPTTVNSSATHWRIYRSKDTGSYPNGWLLATTAIGTTTYADSTADADLVLLAPYPTVEINGVQESENAEPPVLRSVTTFHGSLVGVADRSMYWSAPGNLHGFPASYATPFQFLFGGQARCVRRVGDTLVVLSDNEVWRVNYLPSELDSVFDASVAREHIGNFGTPSPTGACVFSGWGGRPMCFYASRSGPMLTDANSVDRAVRAIDWTGMVSLANLSTCVVYDFPDQWRVHMDFTSDGTTWKRLHFYYDPYRIGTEAGFPELVWTGPHLIPGPGCYATVSGEGRIYAASKTTSGAVYREESGTEDAADLVDASGTVNCRLRIGRTYPGGIGGSGRFPNVWVHKASAGTGSYTTTMTAWKENVGSTSRTKSVSATTQGATSKDFNLSGMGFDVRIVRDDTAAMPAINNITVELQDLVSFLPTPRS
jgi:hypothetical protein